MVEQGRKAQPADPEAGNGTGEAGEAAEVTEVEKEEEVAEADEAEEKAEAEAEADQEPAQEEAAPVTVESLQEELAAAGDALLRAQAEAQNTRRRAEKDVEKARRFALERFSSELLSVVDNLERALQAAEQASGDAEAIDSKAIAEGVDLTLKGLLTCSAASISVPWTRRENPLTRNCTRPCPCWKIPRWSPIPCCR